MPRVVEVYVSVTQVARQPRRKANILFFQASSHSLRDVYSMNDRPFMICSLLEQQNKKGPLRHAPTASRAASAAFAAATIAAMIVELRIARMYSLLEFGLKKAITIAVCLVNTSCATMTAQVPRASFKTRR